MTVQSENFTNATVQITVTNLGGAACAAASMTIDVEPTQLFSFEAGAGTDCTASTFASSTASSCVRCRQYRSVRATPEP